MTPDPSVSIALTKLLEIPPLISGDCDNDWEKLDLAIPYPIPQQYDLSRVPRKVIMFCRRPPDVIHPPPDSMEIDRYQTPPTQERRQFHPVSQPENYGPLFIPEDDCTFLCYALFLLIQP